jgi:hypothetical protein
VTAPLFFELVARSSKNRDVTEVVVVEELSCSEDVSFPLTDNCCLRSGRFKSLELVQGSVGILDSALSAINRSTSEADDSTIEIVDVNETFLLIGPGRDISHTCLLESFELEGSRSAVLLNDFEVGFEGALCSLGEFGPGSVGSKRLREVVIVSLLRLDDLSLTEGFDDLERLTLWHTRLLYL